MYSQRIPTDWANRRCCGDARVVHEIPWSNDIITSNVGFLGDSVVEELGLINYTVFCRVGKNLGDVSIKIFCCHLIGNLAQLTLFPRVSKTSESRVLSPVQSSFASQQGLQLGNTSHVELIAG